MEKQEHAIYFPAKMLEHLQEEAARLERSISWCLQAAWKAARSELGELPESGEHAGADAILEARFASKDKRKQTVIFPTDMLHELQDLATRQNHSLSWLVQRAWCLAFDQIAALPTVKA